MIASTYLSIERTSSPARQSLPTVLLAGPWELAEFSLARQGLPPLADAPVAPTLAAAIERAGASVAPPELVLVAAPRPRMATQEHVEQLGAVAPLARLVVVAGSWCEGEWRTGRPPSGAVRLYWHELASWWRTALESLAAGTAPPWSAPLDEPRAGLFDIKGGQPSVAELGFIAVDSVDYATFETIAAGLSALGWRCRWRPRHRSQFAKNDDAAAFAGGIWDGGQLGATELQDLRQFCQRLPARRAPVIALVDYPRAEHAAAIAEAGAMAVIGKPYQWSHLADLLTAAQQA